jgi:hypothetical protein
MEQYHTIFRSESEISCDEVITRLEDAGIPVILSYVSNRTPETARGFKILIPKRYEQKGRHALIGLYGTIEATVALH